MSLTLFLEGVQLLFQALAELVRHRPSGEPPAPQLDLPLPPFAKVFLLLEEVEVGAEGGVVEAVEGASAGRFVSVGSLYEGRNEETQVDVTAWRGRREGGREGREEGEREGNGSARITRSGPHKEKRGRERGREERRGKGGDKRGRRSSHVRYIPINYRQRLFLKDTRPLVFPPLCSVLSSIAPPLSSPSSPSPARGAQATRG